MTTCRKSLSAYQRRSLRVIEIVLGVCIAIGILAQAVLERYSLHVALLLCIALVCIAPILASIVLVARYLRGENDEYLRNLVMESMLWGLAVLLIADTLLNLMGPILAILPYGNASLDVFVLASSMALELKLWKNR